MYRFLSPSLAALPLQPDSLAFLSIGRHHHLCLPLNDPMYQTIYSHAHQDSRSNTRYKLILRPARITRRSRIFRTRLLKLSRSLPTFRFEHHEWRSRRTRCTRGTTGYLDYSIEGRFITFRKHLCAQRTIETFREVWSGTKSPC